MGETSLRVRDDRYKLMHFYNDIDQWGFMI